MGRSELGPKCYGSRYHLERSTLRHVPFTRGHLAERSLHDELRDGRPERLIQHRRGTKHAGTPEAQDKDNMRFDLQRLSKLFPDPPLPCSRTKLITYASYLPPLEPPPLPLGATAAPAAQRVVSCPVSHACS